MNPTETDIPTETTQAELIREEEPKATVLATFALEWDTVKAIGLFASADETRYALNGVSFEIRPDSVTLAATDGRCLGAIRIGMEYIEGGLEPIDAIMSNDLIKKVNLGKSTLPAKITIKRFKGKLVFRVSDALEDMAFENQAIEGNYPKWRQVYPKGFTTTNVQVLVSPSAIELFTKAHALIGKKDGGIRLLSPESVGDETLPYIIDIGNPDFLGVLMPMRSKDEERYQYDYRIWADAPPEPEAADKSTEDPAE